jgi:hypothetical protein
MRSAIVLLLGATLLVGCRREQVTDSNIVAERFSTQLADAKQAQLWKQVAAGPKRDLSQFMVSERSVQTRRKAVPMEKPARGSTPTLATLPGQQPNGVRILSASQSAADTFTGAATIKGMESERVELDLGKERTLSLLLRVRSRGLRAKPGEAVQLEWRTRLEPENRMEILALMTLTGEGIVSVLDSAKKPVTVQVPLFRLTAAQTGTPEKGSMPVEVSVGDEKQTLRQGHTGEFKSARLAVGLVSSLAVTGEEVNREEGNPYAIRLLAWPVE